MTDKETLKLKRQSRDKWRKIVEDLSRQGPRLHPRLDSDDCGYCKINRVGNNGCCGCCLDSDMLCRSGRGAAFDVVNDFYAECMERIEALRGAKKILVTVERDIKKSEKKK